MPSSKCCDTRFIRQLVVAVFVIVLFIAWNILTAGYYLAEPRVTELHTVPALAHTSPPTLYTDIRDPTPSNAWTADSSTHRGLNIEALLRVAIIDTQVVERQMQFTESGAFAVVLRTRSSEERVLHNIVEYGQAATRAGGNLHVIYFGSNEADVTRLRYTSATVMAAVHCIDDQLLSRLLAESVEMTWLYETFGDETMTMADYIWHKHRYWLEMTTIPALAQHATINSVWVFDWNVQYYGDVARIFSDTWDVYDPDTFIAVAASSIDEDHVAQFKGRNSDLVPVRAITNVKLISPAFLNSVAASIVSSGYIAEESIIFATICENAPDCNLRYLSDVADGVILSTDLLSDQGGNKAIRKFVECSRSYNSSLGNATHSVTQLLTGIGCDLLSNKFVVSTLPFHLREHLLLDAAQTDRIVQDRYCKIKDRDTHITANKLKGHGVSLNSTQTYLGYSTQFWSALHRKSKRGFRIWDLEMIKQQYKVHPEPKVIFVFRTHVASERVIQSLTSIGLALMKYGGHLHVLFQGNNCDPALVEGMRYALSGLHVAVHWIYHRNVIPIIARDKESDDILRRCARSRACRGSVRRYSHLWLFAYLPEILFFANYGPVSENTEIWCIEYDVLFNGDITKLFEAASHVSADVLMPAAGPDKGGLYHNKSTAMLQWPWWNFIGTWAPQHKQFRALASAKRVSPWMAAAACKSTLLDHRWAADELYYGSVCILMNDTAAVQNETEARGCVPKIMNYESAMDEVFQTQTYQYLPFTNETILTSMENRNRLMHKFAIPFDYREHIHLDTVYIPAA